MNIGEFIRNRRIEAGLTQAELYKAIGGKALNGANTISRIETGKQQISWNQAMAILRALGYEIRIWAL